MKRVLIIVGILLIPIVPIVLLVTGVFKSQPVSVKKQTLNVWTTTDDARVFTSLIDGYRAERPYVTIKVTKVRAEGYRDRLLEAWAQGTGPDVFFVPHTWIGAMQSFAAPMPTSLAVPIVESKKGWLGVQTTVTKPAAPAPSIASLRASLVDTIGNDIVRDGRVWGFPLAMDTIVTYSNKDLLNNAKIFAPARTWQELTDQIQQKNLTIIDDNGAIIQSGVALGTAKNLPYATDLMTLIMMQNGATLIDQSTKKVRFDDITGQQAFEFFTGFSNPKKSVYSWNASQPNALDAFLKGKVAYYFGTYADREQIVASGLNFNVGPMLHLDAMNGDRDAASGATRFIDVPMYEVAMVSKAAATAKRDVTAWNFLRYIARTGVVEKYLRSTGRLSALRSILTEQQSDTVKGVFASQLLTTRSWYRGRNIDEATVALEDLITSVVVDGESVQSAIDLAARRVEATL